MVKHPKITIALFSLFILVSAFFISISKVREYPDLMINGSFESDLSSWDLHSETVITMDGHENSIFNLNKAYLDRPIKLSYFPEDLSGELAKSNIIFRFFDNQNKMLSRVCFVLSGKSDYWAHNNTIVDGVSWLTFVVNRAKVGQWNNFQIDNLLKESNAIARKINAPEVYKDEISRVTIGFESWSKSGAIKARYRLRQSDIFDVMVIRDREQDLELADSYIKGSLYLPSDGRQYAQVEFPQINSLTKKLTRLTPGATYFLVFDARNEYGSSIPKVAINSVEGKKISEKTVIMQLAQTGWVRDGLRFTPKEREVVIKLGRNIGEKIYFSNHYDNFHLYRIPEGDAREKEFSYFLQEHHNLVMEGGKTLGNRVPLKSILPKGFQDAMDNEYAGFKIPIRDIYYDEYEYWAKKGFSHWADSYALRRLRGYANMGRGWTRKDGGEKKKMRIKTRGVMPVHHMARRKSYRVNLTKKNELHLLRPLGRKYLLEKFSYFLAREMGLIHIRNDFSFLRLNETPLGVYWGYQVDEKDLELSNRPEGYLIYPEWKYLLDNPRFYNKHIHTIIKGKRKTIVRDGFEQFAKPSNKEYRKRYPHYDITTFFNNLVKSGEIKKAVRMLDVERFLLWDAHLILMGSNHQNWSHNNFLYWNVSAGWLEWVPWDVRAGGAFISFERYNPYEDALITTPLYFNKRNKLLWQFLKSDKLRNKSLNYYDELLDKTLDPFVKSQNHGSSNPPYTKRLDKISPTELRATLLKDRGNIKTRFDILGEMLTQADPLKVLIGAPFVTTKELRAKMLLDTAFASGNSLQPLRDNNYRDTPIHIIKKKDIPNISIWSLKTANGVSMAGTTLDEIHFKGEPRAALLLIDPESGQTIEKFKLKNGVFKVRKTLPSDLFYRYRLAGFWRDRFLAMLDRVDDASRVLLTTAYVTNNKRDGFFYELRHEYWRNPEKIRQLVAVITKVGELPHRELAFRLRLPEDSLVENPAEQISFVFTNSVTDAKVPPLSIEKNVVFITPNPQKSSPSKPILPVENVAIEDDTLFRYFPQIDLLPAQFAARYRMFAWNEVNKTMTLKKGTHLFKETVIVPQGIRELVIEAGTVLKFGANASLVSYSPLRAEGRRDAPIKFQPESPKKPWGVVALLREKAKGKFTYCHIEGGGEAYINGVYFSGMLASHYADLTLTHSVIRSASAENGDDAVNVKYGLGIIENTVFISNHKDAIDFDFVLPGSRIVGVNILDNGNDGIDVSGSEVLIKNTLISGSGDKGISAGEKSEVRIVNARVHGNSIGIASKDLSRANIIDSNISENKIGVVAYNKKEIFGGGHVIALNSMFKENQMDFGIEQFSTDDERRGKKRFRSSALVSNSKYNSTFGETRLLLKKAKKQLKKKKQFVKAVLKDSLGKYESRYAYLKNHVDTSTDTSRTKLLICPPESDPVCMFEIESITW